MRVEDLVHVVHDLGDLAVADAETLIRRLDRELVPAVGEPLVEEVQGVEALQELRVRVLVAVAVAAVMVEPAVGIAPIDRRSLRERIGIE